MSTFPTMEDIQRRWWEVHTSKRKGIPRGSWQNHVHERCKSECQVFFNYRVKWGKTLVTNKANLHYTKKSFQLMLMLQEKCKDRSWVSVVISSHTVVNWCWCIISWSGGNDCRNNACLASHKLLEINQVTSVSQESMLTKKTCDLFP